MIEIATDRLPEIDSVLSLYKALEWSAAKKPEQLFLALQHSHSLVTAWDSDKLIGLGNAISDGHLVVYFPHLLVHPAYQGQGIGKKIIQGLFKRYEGFHMQMLTADAEAVAFYERMGFSRAGQTVPMWIYAGDEH